MRLAIIILNFNSAEITERFVKEIYAYASIDKIIIVDNKSTDDSFGKLSQLSDDHVDVIETEKNGGYGYGNNFGIKYVSKKYDSDFVMIANPDVHFEESMPGKLINVLADDENIAIAAPVMLDTDKKRDPYSVWKVPTKAQYIFSAGLLLNKIIKPYYYKDIYSEANKENKYKEVGCVAGSLFMARTTDMLQYGMFDENIFLYCEETCLGLKLQKAGLKTMLVYGASFVHEHGISINKNVKSEARKRKLLLKSREYLLREYYHADLCEMLAAKIVFAISIFETWLISLVSK